MSNRPKSISIHQLSTAVKNSIGRLKVKPQPHEGPWFYIDPGVICGLIYVGPAAEAQALAASIAKEVSTESGVQLTPVVEQTGAGAKAMDAAAFPHGPVILGYKHDLQVHA